MVGQFSMPVDTPGAGVNQFNFPYALSIDSSGRIYVLDSIIDRVARIDDMTGTNWTVYGAPGNATNHFAGPTGITVDTTNHIYIADSANNRLVEVDDMNGTNFRTLPTKPIYGVFTRQ
jgi:hypothetical protein